MLAISMTFPAKRFHATPWGRQVNEGAVEWPPSPWRLLRALVATWHHKFPDVPEAAVRELIEQLAPAPHFSLPPASQAHTRHYMPLVNDDRTKVFDTYVVVDPEDALIAVWPELRLSDEQRELLDRLLRAMTYFGRAESWVCGQLLDMPPSELEVQPKELGDSAPNGNELVRTLVPIPPEEHAAWFTKTREEHRNRKLDELRVAAKAKGKPIDSVKLSTKDLQAIDNNLPATLFDALYADTTELRKAGWNQPPGTRWINYSRPEATFSSRPTSHTQRRHTTTRPTVARFALCSSVRPLFTDQLLLAEALRKQFMRCSCEIDRRRRVDQDLDPALANAAPVFSGRSENGELLHNHGIPHGHSHILCEASNDHRVTHVTIFAPMGFTPDDERAFGLLVDPKWLRKYPLKWNGYEVQLVLIGLGLPAEFGGTNEKAGQSRLLAESRSWESRTPLVLTRHLTRHGVPSAEAIAADPKAKQALIDVVRFELATRPQFQTHADQVSIEPLLEREQLGTWLGDHFTTWLKFRRERSSGGGSKAASQGFGFRLTFPVPVSGPIALGYGCHFGLGVFRSTIALTP